MIAYINKRKYFDKLIIVQTGNKVLSCFIEISVTVRNILFRTTSESSLGMRHSRLFVIYSTSFYETLALIQLWSTFQKTSVSLRVKF